MWKCQNSQNLHIIDFLKPSKGIDDIQFHVSVSFRLRLQIWERKSGDALPSKFDDDNASVTVCGRCYVACFGLMTENMLLMQKRASLSKLCQCRKLEVCMADVLQFLSTSPAPVSRQKGSKSTFIWITGRHQSGRHGRLGNQFHR